MSKILSGFTSPSAASQFRLIWSKTGITNAGLITTDIFTPPVNGYYYVTIYVEIVSTNNVGTLTFTLGFKNTAGTSQTGLTNVPVSISTGQDARSQTSMAIPGGQPVTIELTATGLTGTVYDVYIAACPLGNI